MSQKDHSTKKCEKKHLKEKDRYQIEALVKAKKKVKEIAEIIGCSRRTIERELLLPQSNREHQVAYWVKGAWKKEEMISGVAARKSIRL